MDALREFEAHADAAIARGAGQGRVTAK
jgi:hypothetical protein